MSDNGELHVVFGTGPVGMSVMDELVERGRRVRMVNRSGRAGVPGGVEVVGGDATDEAFTRKASEGASVVYFALNPPYTRWAELFPPLQAGVVEGAASAGAKLVAVENLYMYGSTGGRPLTEDRPHAPNTRKGTVRAAMSEELMEAHKSGRVRVATGRASDFFGPRVLVSAAGEQVFGRALEGKGAQVAGDPDQPHTYTYMPDIGRALVILGEREEALGQAWHLPSPETVTTREFVGMIFEGVGKPARVQVAPKILLRAVGLFNPPLRETIEMLYEFEEPFVVDHSKFERAFGDHATPLEEAIRDTVRWYRTRRPAGDVDPAAYRWKARKLTTPAPILATKLYAPPPRPKAVPRPRLTERLREGLHHRVTLISAPAGFGKTTLVGEWVAGCGRPAAWLSLEEADGDPARFLYYLVAALQTVAANIGEGVLGALRSPQPPPIESTLTALLNEIDTIADDFVLVLDDYHVIDARPVDDALAFLIEHLPPRMHLIIATREDPNLPLARLRVRGQLAELRAADLRFTPSEAAEFLDRAMGLSLSPEDVAALETRTEGWIAGLQLAAISMQGHEDTTGFIESFTGSHHFVLDYLVEEVLRQQPESVQAFLLRTSILDRLCGSLCDAVLLDPSASGQETLEYVERANLFLVPLDDERRWYRYHHLFADLLRQRLLQGAASSTGEVNDLHRRASQWYEENGLEIDAFEHAAAANDVERAERLVEGAGVPLYFRGTVAPVLKWLASLPETVLDSTPSLWVMYASTLLLVDHTAVEQRLQAAEAALRDTEPDDRTRDLAGRIASMRATLAVIQHDAETIITQSRRALEYLHPDNLPLRTATTWTLGHAHQLQGDRAAARRAYDEVISTGKSSGDSVYIIAATINLGQLQEGDNRLPLAAKTYRHVLQLAGDPPQPIACEACLGLARITYEWNDLDAAEQHGQQFIRLTRHMGSVDSFASYDVFLARLKLAGGDVAGAVATLTRAEEFVRQHGFGFRMPDVAAAQVLASLHQGNLAAAAHLAETHELPVSQARVHLAQGDTSAALAALGPLRPQVEAKGWEDERLRVMVLQAVALHAHGLEGEAAQLLGEALALAERGGFIRIFVDEGAPMARLLSESAARGIAPGYTARLLAAFEAEEHKSADPSHLPPALPAQPLVEPLSRRELEVLRLVAQGLSNR